MEKNSTEEFKTKKNKNNSTKDRRKYREFTRSIKGFSMDDLDEIWDEEDNFNN